MKSWNSLLLASFLVAAGCEKRGGEKAARLTSDMTGADSVAVVKPALSSASFQAFGAEPEETPDPEAFSTLVKIDSNGVIDSVFNQQRPVFAVLVSTTHVVAFGDFHDILAQTADGEGEKALDCYLVVFPRTATGEAVKCLSKIPIGVYPLHPDSTYVASDRALKDPIGFTVRGADVYFTDAAQYANDDEDVTHMWKWAGGSDQLELLLQFDAAAFTDNLAKPHVAEGAAYGCVQTLHPNIDFRVLCSPVDGAVDWQDVGATTTAAENGSHGLSLVMGTNLMFTNSVVNLTNATVTTSGRSLPRDRTVTLTGPDRVYGINGPAESNGALIWVMADGSGATINGAIDWDHLVGLGDAGYVYGDSELRRLDLTTAVLGTANLLGDTTLLNVSDMSISSGTNIRIDGTTSSGIPSVVLVDTITGDITVTEEDVPRFVSVTPLQ